MNREDLSYQMGRSIGYSEGMIDGIRWQQAHQEKHDWKRLRTNIFWSALAGAFVAIFVALAILYIITV
jgi:hypothetical protein